MTEPLDLGSVYPTESMITELWVHRGQSIQSYANLEQSLCTLFSTLSGIDTETAPIIFFKIVATRVRTTILENLLKHRHNGTYNTFWNSFRKLLFTLDETRNAIVHWNAVIDVDHREESGEIVLMPPNMMNMSADTPAKRNSDMVEFTEQCDFLARLCTMFSLFLSQPSSIPEDAQKTWRDIFLQSLTYPPQTHHPLFLTDSTNARLLRSYLMK